MRVPLMMHSPSPRERQDRINDRIFERFQRAEEIRRRGKQAIIGQPELQADILLYGGRRSEMLFSLWERNGRNTLALFSLQWHELPLWLTEDFLTLDHEVRWHEWRMNIKDERGTGSPQ